MLSPDRTIISSAAGKSKLDRVHVLRLSDLQAEIGMGAWSAANAIQIVSGVCFHNGSIYSCMSSCAQEAKLKELKPVKLASYNSILSEDVNRRTCTANTRKVILSDVNHWSDDSCAEKVFWLDGMAGTGKTTIAYTLSEALQSRGQLAASFFCTRTSPECRDAKRIVPTIAYQLARHSTPFRWALSQALEKNPDAGSLNILAQFDQLLKDPLAEVHDKMAKNMVVVIDALDECDDNNIIVRVLDMLFRFAANLPVKFFVTSRPEPAIREKMMSQPQGSRLIMHLHEIEQSIVQADIELYLQEELASMSPSSGQINQLVGFAGNLFIYAATAVRYICPNDIDIDSDERLGIMLSVDANSEKKFEHINVLYSTILDAALNNTKLEPQERNRRKLVLWTAVCAREPISTKTLAVLAGLENEKQAARALQPLRSVLYVSEHNSLVTTLHASFSDYMFSQERSGEFFCDQKICNQLVARRCFEIMKGQLRFNICELESSFIFDENVSDLKSRLEKNISHELFYACQYWANHLKLAGMSNGLITMLEEFLSQHLLFWMEVMSLNKCMVTGVLGLADVQAWLAVRNY